MGRCCFLNILLVEDEKRMAEALCEVLKLENYEVTHCADVADGLKYAESFGLKRNRQCWSMKIRCLTPEPFTVLK